MSILRNESIISGLSDLSHRPELDKKRKEKETFWLGDKKGEAKEVVS